MQYLTILLLHYFSIYISETIVLVSILFINKLSYKVHVCCLQMTYPSFHNQAEYFYSSERIIYVALWNWEGLCKEMRNEFRALKAPKNLRIVVHPLRSRISFSMLRKLLLISFSLRMLPNVAAIYLCFSISYAHKPKQKHN